ncbi:FAD/NAD(P)-binding protein [Flavobacterium macacae]|uniref:FAD-dependent urate hydroxylase HpyO/Asp monooxygenase CreE-like FAD/NAD(P)-binding domain-containing protein n=1 Tax=Flavobacterium macacae TaxID=2488993 RepID=A0A3P3W8I8_9FLAO|nr:FAD/NAD(P)-binding protein [Flavobacterium macacae]RRJ88963.1 hypothetical protein EG849_13940 [Flavobacterium macacae]
MEEKTNSAKLQHTAIIGAGPSGLFMLKRLLENGDPQRVISIFEKKNVLGAGMPYSDEGANREHITNVSANEIPDLVTSVADWLETVPLEVLDSFGIRRNHFNEYKVLPRLLFGKYLESQFDLLLLAAERAGITVKSFLDSKVVNIADDEQEKKTTVFLESGESHIFDSIVICTGHKWPKTGEGKIEGYYDSPYPPKKLHFGANHAVAIRGSSLTAIDAIRTLSRSNGKFHKKADGTLLFEKSPKYPNFEMVMHSKNGLLPAVRFHLEDPHLGNNSLLTEEEIKTHIAENNGFLSLDFIFENDFKKILLQRDPEAYKKIEKATLEEFTDFAMNQREEADVFTLFEKEYKAAEQSIERKESIYWKELLAILSFELNYPAKYLSAEDMLRLQKSLKPLISVIIAFVPQASAVELLALHEAGALKIVAVGENSEIIPGEEKGITYRYSDEEGNHEHYYETFVDCIGQPALSFDSFPFQGLKEGTVSKAYLQLKDTEAGRSELAKGNKKVHKLQNDYYMEVPGLAINDDFQVIGENGLANERIYIMAVPYISGYNPDYSGLDFCEAASEKIAESLLETFKEYR